MTKREKRLRIKLAWNSKHLSVPKCLWQHKLLKDFLLKKRNNITVLVKHCNHMLDKVAYDYYMSVCKKCCKTNNYLKTTVKDFVNCVSTQCYILGVVLTNDNGTKYRWGDFDTNLLPAKIKKMYGHKKRK